MGEFAAKHLLVEDSFEFPDKGTVVATTVVTDRWEGEGLFWENAGAIEIAGQRYKLLSWSFATNKFRNCLSGSPTSHATFYLLIDGQFPRGHFKRGAVITLCD